jgi:hypothetical protein
MNIEKMLDEYAVLEGSILNHEKINNEKRKILDQAKENMITSILTEDQKKQLEEINAELQSKYDALNNDQDFAHLKVALADQKKVIVDEVLKVEKTIHGTTKMAVFIPKKTEEKVIVNTDMLKAFTIDIKKLQACWTVEKNETPASVTIRKK